MKSLPTDLHREAGREALRTFLEACRDEAEDDGHYKIVSISLATGYLDALAVLDSIYEPNAWHFYGEWAGRGEAIAGAEAVVMGEWSGPDRFVRMRDCADTILEHTIAVGDLDASFSGPHFFAGFSFADTVEADAAFPAAVLFLPQWQVSVRDNAFTAVANCRVDADADLDALTDRIWSARDKFNRFKYEDSASAAPDKLEIVSQSDNILAQGRGFQEAVALALEEINQGLYEKIVLARSRDLTFSGPCRPLSTLHGLRSRFANCYAFSFQNETGDSFIGATPERLVRVEQGKLVTEAIAGSTPRGSDPAEDAALAKGLLESEKDQREHRHVVDSILNRLQALGLQPEAASSPRLLNLANVRHLWTPVSAALPESAHILDYVAELHPTPAVGGTPREQAVTRILEIEGQSRSLYAGLIGWFNHRGEGEFAVAIRSAWVRSNQARLYAGAGIVQGSDPEKEYSETQVKMNALLLAMGGE
ncbi:MAG: isochorismate synthase [Opitutales bacterium]|nr:isochorismate synthase [Opitutales bacterium]